MAHAYKKTLLAQLGFADADKQNPKHDLAVEYLALEHNAKRLIQSIHPGFDWEPLRPIPNKPDWASLTIRRLSDLRTPERERPLTKGEGQYRSTVGFLDLLVRYSASKTIWEYVEGRPPRTVYDLDHDREPSGPLALVVEVKAGHVPTGDLLRQMKLYREYADTIGGVARCSWVVAGCFKFTETQAHALRQEGITPVSLGPLFDEWAERQRTDRTLATDIEEF